MTKPKKALAPAKSSKELAVPKPLRAPTKREQREIDGAKARAQDMRLPLALKVSPGGASSDISLGPLHSDLEGYTEWLMDTMGSQSFNFIEEQLFLLEYGTRFRGVKRNAENGARHLNSGLAIVSAIRPENELEAALAVQMAMNHHLTSEMLGRTRHTDNTDRMQLYGNLAVKLQRTFTAQIEALARLRGKGQQTVRVEHVTVQPGGQAIVGDVHHHPGGPGSPQLSGGQPHAQSQVTADAPLAALPSPDEAGVGVPLSFDAKRKVPITRGKEHGPAEGEQERF